MDQWAAKLWSATVVMAAGAALLLAASPAAAADPAKVKLIGGSGGFPKKYQIVAVPAYHVTYITQQQATAVGSIGARTRLNTVLTGVDDATMKRLANEAHADLIAQLTAAGVPVVPQEAAVAMAQGVEALPGNRDADDVGPGITIGKSIKKGYVTYGADAAPALRPYHNPTSPTGAMPLSAMGANNTIGKAAMAASAYAMIPHLVFDYIDMDASTSSGFLGGASASTSGDLSFSLRATSTVTWVGAAARGPGYAGGTRLDKDMTWKTAFGRVEEGGAGVRTGSMTAVSDRNYQTKQRARGDAVVVDPAMWEGLVREGFRNYNRLIVATVVSGKP